MNKNAFILHIAIGVNVKQNLFSFSGIPRVCNKIQLQLNFSFFNIHVNDISDINVPWICQSELEVQTSVSLCISSQLHVFSIMYYIIMALFECMSHKLIVHLKLHLIYLFLLSRFHTMIFLRHKKNNVMFLNPRNIIIMQ